jgi:hypothetical protein
LTPKYFSFRFFTPFSIFFETFLHFFKFSTIFKKKEKQGGNILGGRMSPLEFSFFYDAQVFRPFQNHFFPFMDSKNFRSIFQDKGEQGGDVS